jgi:addiction module RelE/StbE family toxin
MWIRWTKQAANDLTRISDYTEDHFGAAQARRAALAIYETSDSLKNLPQPGRLGRKPDTRELVISDLPFLVVYRLRGQTVEIMRVLHGARRWP